MILQQLCRYYDRLAEDPEHEIAKQGWVVQGVAFEVVINSRGELVRIGDLRQVDGKKISNKRMLLPGKAKPSGSGLNPSLHGWDRTDYMLGYLDAEVLKPAEREKRLKRCAEAHHEFKRAMLALRDTIVHADFLAFCSYLESWKPEMAVDYPLLKEVSGLFGIVRYSDGQNRYLHDLPALQERGDSDDSSSSYCLVTGKYESVARTHEIKIKGVNGAQSSGAAIVSFNLGAFESFNKRQSHNAPVSEAAAFKYATALNKLLEPDSRHRMQIGDTTCVFWASAPNEAEDIFGFGVGGNRAEDTDQVRALEASFSALKAGTASVPNAETGFYVLGLSPNVSRISVRFWFTGTIGEMMDRVVGHQRELDIVRTDKDRDILPSWQILSQTARESKDIPPLLAGALMRAILTGGRYPEALYAAILRRIRADREIRHSRVATLKAILNRNHHKEIAAMLDPERPEPAYQLGRLFAALEKAQEDASLPTRLNATIKDRYYGAASATPGAVFPRLIRLSQHHLAKLEGGRKIVADKRVQEICGHIETFPPHLDLVGQGLFALGYYHQRQDFFTKKPTLTENS